MTEEQEERLISALERIARCLEAVDGEERAAPKKPRPKGPRQPRKGTVKPNDLDRARASRLARRMGIGK